MQRLVDDFEYGQQQLNISPSHAAATDETLHILAMNLGLARPAGRSLR